MIDQTFDFAVAGATLAVASVLLWILVRSHRRRWAREDAVDLRVREMASSHLKIGGAFGYGAAAALMCEDAWTNPHCAPDGSKAHGAAWAAGWCYGRQQLDGARRAED